ncbi:MAG: Type I secretion system, outer membrane component LapE [Candidatus Ozemobacter sibiricus]|uniref:Type I secretion system, outer membrane component LapE n=1 Tax=Candidatus Ozemobacter sibiricus TaxID=2268124 RepID=A0A367ZUB2_9BACT|nr:MAG: Type I secretion system, outer membrane component LapE [Candidatus Ozemobacter sibiricus]
MKPLFPVFRHGMPARLRLVLILLVWWASRPTICLGQTQDLSATPAGLASGAVAAASAAVVAPEAPASASPDLVAAPSPSQVDEPGERPAPPAALSSAHILEAISSVLPPGLRLDPSVVIPEEEPDLLTPAVASRTTMSLSLAEALSLALAHQPDLEVKRLEIGRQEQGIELGRIAFDPTVTAAWSMSDRLGKQITQTGTINENISNRTQAEAGWSRTSPSGTRVAVGLTMTRGRSARAPNLFDTRLGLDLTHPLRRGAGHAVNLVGVRQAELDVRVAQEEVEGYVLALLAEVEHAYWQLLLSRQELAIVRSSARLARQQQEETARRIALGSLPESELAAAAAEVALREEAVINAESAVERARIGLLRLVNPDAEHFWMTNVTLTDLPEIPDFEIRSAEPHLHQALTTRPELQRARLLLERDELELVRTRNGLLPRLDFFVTLGKTGYAQTFGETFQEFGQRAYDLQAGLRFDLTPGRRQARALDQRARYSRQQRQEALRNLQRLIQEEVLRAILEVQRALQQVKATAQTVARQREKRRAEEIKFQVGKTTAFQVAQAQRDEAASEIAALKARIGVLNALTDLYRADGSLAARRGVVVAAGAPPLATGPAGHAAPRGAATPRP